MIFWLFFKKGFYFFLVVAIFGFVLQKVNFLNSYNTEVWAGLIIASLNFLLGSAIISWGFQKGNKQFMGSFFGGMIVRFFLMFLILFVLVKYFDYHINYLAGSLLFNYFGYLVIEIWTISKLPELRSDAR